LTFPRVKNNPLGSGSNGNTIAERIMHIADLLYVEPRGETWLQFGELLLALVLSSLIGLEREFRAKSAGLRTHTLVGVAAALIVLVSKYGFADTILKDAVVLDPSRVAAQIVSGIGFIGGGLIFVQRDVVRGLTTAAIIWLTAAVGMACGAGLPLLALFVTTAHFLVVYGYTSMTRRVLSQHAELHVRYAPGKGAVEKIMQICTGRGYAIQQLAVEPIEGAPESEARAIQLQLSGRRGAESLVVAVADIKGVISASLAPTPRDPD
jgi:putative Mg2+ transporter-C (MgtC) family protein